MDRHLHGCDEACRPGSRNRLAPTGGGFVGMGGDDRGGPDQLIDHVGRFTGSGGEGVADIDHRQFGAIVVAYDPFLLGGDPGVAGEVDGEAVGEGHHIAGGRSRIGGEAGGIEHFTQLAADHRALDAIGVDRGDGGDPDPVYRTGAAEPDQLRRLRIAAQGLELVGEERRHFAAGDDHRLVRQGDLHAAGVGQGVYRRLGFVAAAGIRPGDPLVAHMVPVHMADQHHIDPAQAGIIRAGHRAPGIVEQPGAVRVLQQKGAIESAELAVMTAQRSDFDNVRGREQSRRHEE